MNKKFLLVIIAVCLIVSSCSNRNEQSSGLESQSDENEGLNNTQTEIQIDIKAEPLSEENIESLVVDFINTTLSDFATEDTYQDYLIDENATVFRQFLKDKRKVGIIKQKISGNLTLVQSEVKDFSYKKIKENLYEITCTFQRSAVIGEKKENIFFEEGYKLLVINNSGKMNVIAGMDSSLSTGPLFPKNIVTPTKDLDLSFFINEDYSIKTKGNLPYDMEDIESTLLK